jgi:DNA mismatch endonuclease, patch repair protein
MSRIRGRHTSPERLLRGELWKRGHRYRLHTRTPVGAPDLVFAGRRVAVFVDGCFWHGCPSHYVRPRTRNEFWDSKLKENVDRDRRQTLVLKQLGWRVVRLWEHEVWEDLDRAARMVVDALEASTYRERLDWRVVRVSVLDPIADTETRVLETLLGRTPPREVVQRRSTKKWRRTAREPK